MEGQASQQAVKSTNKSEYNNNCMDLRIAPWSEQRKALLHLPERASWP